MSHWLSKNGKFSEAMKWFHYIFDPTTDALPKTGESEISRYWKVLPFKTTQADSLEDWFKSLAPNSNANVENDIIAEWRDKPFRPHLVARNRPIAYMKNVVLKYVENLVAWGDMLFTQDTRESINEATQLYVMANHILGPRPEFVPKRGNIKAETYDSLKSKFDDFSNALVQLENIFPYSSEIPAAGGSYSGGVLGAGKALYFGIPTNDKLLGYWDTVTDRLYKIRHCQNINGVERSLSLFEPPIDPGMIVQAAAQGLSLGSILSDLSSPPPIYRFSYLVQRAADFIIEVKSLGASLLSALEKKDAEELSKLRATHERQMLEMVTAIKVRQVLDARSNKEAILKSRDASAFKLQHYVALLGNPGVSVPGAPEISNTLTADSTLPADTIIAEVVPDVDTALEDSDETGVKLISREKTELEKLSDANTWSQIASGLEGIAAGLHFIPDVDADGKPFGVGGGVKFGGSHFGAATSALAKIPQIVSSVYTYQAGVASRMAGYIRREQEWSLMANTAIKEIIQLDKQVAAASLKVQIAEKDLENHNQQIENAKQVELFLQNKYTNQELYQWMKEQLFAVYKQSYNIAFDMAKKTERCYRYETGNEMASFIQYGYWDNAHQGLLAGEKLYLALRQLEKSFLEENKRELELTKHVSLSSLNPLALQELRETGKCFIKVPEELFDLDFPGHYFRRIKSVSLSIPCIAGPYTSINGTLRLLQNTIRINTVMNADGNYEHNNDEGVWIDDDRFRSSNVPVKSIATSTALNDSGLFELIFRDERYLPFEGAGAISEWKLELNTDKDLRQFDYATISDIIIHLNYTAREDAGLFKTKATTYIKDYLVNAAELSIQPLRRMFSLKHEFSTEWYKFLHPASPASEQVFTVNLRKEHFPFFTQHRDIHVMQLDFLARTTKNGDYHLLFSAKDEDDNALNTTQVTMPPNPLFDGLKKATLAGVAAGMNVEDIDVFKPLSLKLKFNTAADFRSLQTSPDEVNDIYVVIHYYLADL